MDSNLHDGICYIETGSLDGEKTLKIKYSPTFTKGKFSKSDEKKEKNDNLNNCRNSEIFLLNKENDGGGIKLNPKISKNQNNQNNKLNSHIVIPK